MKRLLFLCLVLMASCEQPEPPASDQAMRPAKLFRVTPERVTQVTDFVGRVEAAETVDLSFEVPGEVVEFPVREGQTVPAGDLIAALSPRYFVLAVEEARVQLKLATQDLERKEALLRERSIPQAAVDEARAQYEMSRVRLAQAEERRADARITAPFEGVVARRYVDNRSRVRAGDPIVRLLYLNELEVVANLSDAMMATITADRVVAVTASFDFLPGQTFPLTYQENSGEANPIAQTYEFALTMARPAGNDGARAARTRSRHRNGRSRDPRLGTVERALRGVLRVGLRPGRFAGRTPRRTRRHARSGWHHDRQRPGGRRSGRDRRRQSAERWHGNPPARRARQSALTAALS
jgi:multidrug efflux pump subunit AcrA (membrane-fusion protein)